MTEEKKEFIKNKILEQMKQKKEKVMKKFENARAEME